jgi:uncharacterized membrane protein
MQQHATTTDATFTSDTNLRSIAKSRERPVHKLLVSFSAAYFTGALITDLVYWKMPDVIWERFSIWLIVAGLILAGFAAIAFVIDLASGRQIERPVLPRVAGYALAVVLSLVNAFVHSRDGYTAVVPQGLTLSALVVVVLFLTSRVSTALANRSRVGG